MLRVRNRLGFSKLHLGWRAKEEGGKLVPGVQGALLSWNHERRSEIKGRDADRVRGGLQGKERGEIAKAVLQSPVTISHWQKPADTQPVYYSGRVASFQYQIAYGKSEGADQGYRPKLAK